MNRRKFFALIFFLLLTVGLNLLKVPLASSQGTTLVAAQIAGDLPLNDPNSPLWQKTTAVEVPLSAQTVIKPILRQTRVKSVTARALHNGAQIAFLVEWQDDTKNDQMLRVQDFRDAVALQFPQVTGQPFFCMGMQGGNVDIWHWKADWQADLLAWQDMENVYPNMAVDQYPFAQGERPHPADYQDTNYLPALAANNLFAMPRLSPVEDLVAGGFGTLTAQPAAGQNVQGFGVWENGRWRVIFSRDLNSPEADDVKFSPGQVYSVAFAAWDGANGERNGEKSTSQWVSLQLERRARPEAAAQAGRLSNQTILLIIMGVLVLLIAIGTVIYFRLPDEG
ncbi:MAG: ethylbenzene dehydrogenase-related protein [Anaerolineales bacterium]